MPIIPPTTAPPVTGAYTPRTGAPETAPPVDIFSSDGFLRLLASQIRAQNPLEPMKDTEFVAQMAQFSQLEQTTNLAKDMQALTVSSRLSQGASLLGREVTYMPAGAAVPATGRVDSFTVDAAGRSMSLVVGGVAVDVTQITQVGA